MKKYDVFISYSSKDLSIANQIYQYLTQKGLSCWISFRDVNQGEIWAESITDGISNSKIFLLILTSNSNKSNQVFREIEFADKRSIPLYCLKTANLEIKDSINYFFSSIQQIEFIENDFSSVLDDFVTKILAKGIIEISKTDDEAAIDPQYIIQILLVSSANLYDKGDFQSAFLGFLTAADIYDHEDANLNVGVMYYRGMGVEKNLEKAITYLNKAKDKSNSYAMLYLSSIYLEEKPYIDLVKSDFLLNESAKLKNPVALNNLALMYQQGTRVVKNIDTAINLYKQAAESGEFSAFLNLGNIYFYEEDFDGKDELLGFYYFQKAHENGVVSGTVSLGTIYYNGRFVEKDYEKSYALFSEAANSENPEACYMLAIQYQEGKGVNVDYKKMIELFEKSANKNYTPALQQLGLIYYFGYYNFEVDFTKSFTFFLEAYKLGDKSYPALYLSLLYFNPNFLYRSNDEGLKYLIESVNTNNKEAMYFIGDYYYYGKYLSKNANLGIKWLEKSFNSGFVQAGNKLGWMYYSDDLIKSDEKSLFFFSKASELGDLEATFMKGLFYLHGIGTQKNQKTGLENVKISAEGGHIDAYYFLGNCYLKGIGIEADRNKALLWLKKSAENGNTSAIDLLKKL